MLKANRTSLRFLGINNASQLTVKHAVFLESAQWNYLFVAKIIVPGFERWELKPDCPGKPKERDRIIRAIVSEF